MMVTNNSINNTVGSSDSGLTNTLTVQNTSNTASSQATILTTVGGTSAGDTWHQFNVGTTRSYSIGIDNSDANDSLKFTTDADGTVDPSSGTFLGAINPSTGGLEWGPDANATSSAAKIISAQKNYDGSTTIGVTNTSSGTSAFSGFIASNDATFATITVPSSGNTTTAVRNTLFLNADDASNNGIVCNVKSTGFFRWYGPVSGGAKWADLASTGLTIPVQPAFLAFNSATDTNATGDGTVVTVDFDTEVFDQGNNFSADTFTAPVTGRYQLNTNVYVNGLSAANTIISLNIVTSNRSYAMDFPHLVANSNHSVGMSVLADMDSGDTATVTVSAAGSTKTSGIFGNGTLLATSFSGHLAC